MNRSECAVVRQEYHPAPGPGGGALAGVHPEEGEEDLRGSGGPRQLAGTNRPHLRPGAPHRTHQEAPTDDPGPAAGLKFKGIQTEDRS